MYVNLYGSANLRLSSKTTWFRGKHSSTYENQKVKGRKVSDNETETNCKLTKSSNFD